MLKPLSMEPQAATPDLENWMHERTRLYLEEFHTALLRVIDHHENNSRCHERTASLIDLQNTINNLMLPYHTVEFFKSRKAANCRYDQIRGDGIANWMHENLEALTRGKPPSRMGTILKSIALMARATEAIYDIERPLYYDPHINFAPYTNRVVCELYAHLLNVCHHPDSNPDADKGQGALHAYKHFLGTVLTAAAAYSRDKSGAPTTLSRMSDVLRPVVSTFADAAQNADPRLPQDAPVQLSEIEGEIKEMLAWNAFSLQR